MRLRYQRGCLRRTKRKSGPDCWEFLWREDDPIGKRVRRTAVIGTVQQYPTDVLARAAVNGLRIYINQDRNRRREQRVLVADLVDHYIQTDRAKIRSLMSVLFNHAIRYEWLEQGKNPITLVRQQSGRTFRRSWSRLRFRAFCCNCVRVFA